MPHILADSLRDRYRGIFRADLLLPTLFFSISVQHLSTFSVGVLGIDARIYYRAAAAWVDGTSPWDAFAMQQAGGEVFHFAALPTAAVLIAPLTTLAEDAFVAIWLLISAVLSIWTIRRLGLSWWWLMFPPTILGVVSGNPQNILLALLLSSSAPLRALAPMLKVYALLPLLTRRMFVSAALAVVFASVTWFAARDLWLEYGSRSSEIVARLNLESVGGHSAWVRPELLLPPALLGLALLWMVDQRATGWLAAPAVFPATQFHISTMALPVIAGGASPWLAAGLAIPIQGVAPLVIAAFGVLRFVSAFRARATRE